MEPKKKRLLIRILAILLAASLFFTIRYEMVERSFKKQTPEYTDANVAAIVDKFETPEQSKYGSNIKQYDKASEFYYWFIDAINNKEFEKAYNMLDDNYVEFFDYNSNKFKAMYDFKTVKTFKIDNFEVMNNEYLATVDIFDELPSEDSGDYDYKDINRGITFFIDNGTLKLFDKQIIADQTIGVEKKVPNRGLKVVTDRIVTTSKELIAQITIVNTGNQRVVVKEFNAVLGTGKYKERHTGDEFIDYQIEQNSQKTIKVTYDNLRGVDGLMMMLEDGEVVQIY